MPKIKAATIDEHKEQTRAALLDAGARLFVRSGLAGTSIGTLADDAGIARTTVYEYFPNKEAVLADLIDERLPPIVDQILEDLPEGPPANRLAEILQRSFTMVMRHPVEATLLFRISRELPKPERDAAWSVFDPIRLEMVRVCREGIAAGEFSGMDARSLGTIVADHLVGGIDEISVRGDIESGVVAESRLAFLRHGLGVRMTGDE
ncbi:MAG: TetR/AcrR family transcriptional regulator [Acidimicrobiia bacterium]|nr:TetR/AcrR family transcriptional regulator [Acidimicrobiia bacterium]